VQLIPTSHLITPERWTAREEMSPSRLKTAADAPDLGIDGGCLRAHMIRYLRGIKAAGTTRGQAFGSLVHAALEEHMSGGHVKNFERKLDARKCAELATLDPKLLVELKAAAPVRAMSALHLLPKRSECDWIREEQRLIVDTAEACPDIEPIKWSPMCATDLVFQRGGVVYSLDYKTTAGKFSDGVRDPWFYVPTPEQLTKDVQFICEALSVMQACGLQDLWCRWIYILSNLRESPQAKPVDVRVTRAQMVEAIVPWVKLADRLRVAVRLARSGAVPELNDMPEPSLVYPHDGSPCTAYGRGCTYHESNGGPCTARDNTPSPILDILNPTGAKTDMTEQIVSPPGSSLAQRLGQFAPEALAKMPPEGQAIANGTAPPEPPQQQNTPRHALPQSIPQPFGPRTGVQAFTEQGYPCSCPTGHWVDTNGNPIWVDQQTHELKYPDGTPLGTVNTPPLVPHSVTATPPLPAQSIEPAVVRQPKEGGKPRRKSGRGGGPRETEESIAARVKAWEMGWAEPEPTFEPQNQPAPTPTPTPEPSSAEVTNAQPESEAVVDVSDKGDVAAVALVKAIARVQICANLCNQSAAVTLSPL